MQTLKGLIEMTLRKLKNIILSKQLNALDDAYRFKEEHKKAIEQDKQGFAIMYAEAMAQVRAYEDLLILIERAK